MELTNILLLAFGSTMLLIGVLILFQLRRMNRTLDLSDDRARADRKAADDRAREDRKAADDHFKAADDRAREDREAADDRARQYSKVAEDCAREDREAADDCAKEYFKAADDRARADREANRAEHARLLSAVDHLLGKVSDVERKVSELKADVKVLRDRSDRSERSKNSAGSTD